MKSKDVASNYGLEPALFDNWLKEARAVPYKTGLMGGLTIEDGVDIDDVVDQFRQYLVDYEARMTSENAAKLRADEEAALAAQEKQRALASMLITSGFSFDGYTITKYSGYISGDDVVQVDRGSQGLFSRATNVGESLMASLTVIRRNALAELKEAAYELGCNAVIGVDFDYLTLDPETVNANGGTLYMPYVFGVTANGNAVVIEKN
ncbi:heavy metal-binding domain-containing protein [Sphingomonas panacisoli]|uniref:Heavy metal-binding domain-containing protein n=1 Tax=Sphingomonas panacisoli TaxID=1813879 RepID=A0A5B8LE50_9SPHN|nr:heavy metal-binding domain-containing protein [Sphingomonas panacisoli]QDZ06397.1 heavy metal-binding domain-containing protein [Sphingomonas panacisoli]